MKRIVLLGFLLVAATAHAETYYVTDKLIITMRSGMGVKYQILKTLVSGTPLDILEEDHVGSTAYARVRTRDGAEGWVLRQYLDSTPIARERLSSSRKELDSYRKENADLKSRLDVMEKDLDALVKSQLELKTENKSLRQELEHIRNTSARSIELDKDNAGLRKKLQKTSAVLDSAQSELGKLRSDATRNWFIIGAGVAIACIVLGMLLTRIRWKKRDEWGSL